MLTESSLPAVGCDASMLNGYHAPANSTSSIVAVGTAVTVDTKCSIGYRPENSTNTATCQADGTWAFGSVRCNGTLCQVLVFKFAIFTTTLLY